MATAVRSQTPIQDGYGSVSHPQDAMVPSRGHSVRSGSRPHSFAGPSGTSYNVSHGAAVHPSPVAHHGRFQEEFDATSYRGSSLDGRPGIQRSVSQMSHSRSGTPTRLGTLKKKSSLSKRGSMRRSGSRRSMRAGSVRSLVLGDKEKYAVGGEEDANSAFYVPVPTGGNPTEVLANRFQAWRKILKDLIIFFKEVQKSYETRSKLFLSTSNIISNTSLPPTFLKSGGLGDATEILRDFHRQGYLEANKAAEVESEVVNQLMGLRNDLHKKTKEIRALSGDFRNSVDKEVEATRKSVRHLHEALGLVDTDPSATSGKGDPFIVRLNVDKQIEKQMEEENYLHRAYLNLEKSGRELESIVVSEIQKAYNAYASILKREAEDTLDTAEKLRAGPISMPRDHEWNAFIANTDEMVDPRVPLRDVENITYPGKDHPAAAEIRSGMLERKSKYLKSYTPGWYVLSPTHLHEFKSADRVAWQTPVMSLYLPEQKLGSHSQPDSTSHKFMLKGRQTGTMHRGHSWVFRAESYETMMAWYEDVEGLISKTGEARNAYVRKHVRTVSGASFRSSSDGAMDEDEADRTPYSGSAILSQERPTSQPRQPGGRFPSDVQIDRHAQAPLSPSSEESSGGKDLLAAAGSLQDETPFADAGKRFYSDQEQPAPNQTPAQIGVATGAGSNNRIPADRHDHDSYYGDWMGPSKHTVGQQAPPFDNRAAYASNQEHAANHPTFIAGLGSTSATQDKSVPRQRNRGESSSTAFTSSNVTDHTHNTVPTSVDEGPESDDHMQAEKPVHTILVSNNSAPRSIPSEVSFPNGAPDSSSEKSKRSLAQSKNSSSTIELRIPGHFPPQQAAA